MSKSNTTRIDSTILDQLSRGIKLCPTAVKTPTTNKPGATDEKYIISQTADTESKKQSFGKSRKSYRVISA